MLGMTLENLIYATIAAVVGAAATVITTVIKQKKDCRRIDEEKIKLNIEKIVNDLNVGDVHFYILNENRDFSTENTIKHKFKSNAANMSSNNFNSFYQIKGKSGRSGVLIIGGRVDGVKKYARKLSRCF
tara:strand:+ start:1565 stop:1951 length:387 start_codon:yes stop_codon:yes gene_type:complete